MWTRHGREAESALEAKGPPGGAWQKQTVVMSTERLHGGKEARPKHWAGREAAGVEAKSKSVRLSRWTDKSIYPVP